MKKQNKQFIQAVCARANVTVRKVDATGGNHLRLWVNEYDHPFILPSTPKNQWRTMLNSACFIRRTVAKNKQQRPPH